MKLSVRINFKAAGSLCSSAWFQAFSRASIWVSSPVWVDSCVCGRMAHAVASKKTPMNVRLAIPVLMRRSIVDLSWRDLRNPSGMSASYEGWSSVASFTDDSCQFYIREERGPLYCDLLPD